MYKRKYQQGKQIKYLNDLFNYEFFYHQGKTYHRVWIHSWSFNYLVGQIKLGRLFVAERSEE